MKLQKCCSSRFAAFEFSSLGHKYQLWLERALSQCPRPVIMWNVEMSQNRAIHWSSKPTMPSPEQRKVETQVTPL